MLQAPIDQQQLQAASTQRSVSTPVEQQMASEAPSNHEGRSIKGVATPAHSCDRGSDTLHIMAATNSNQDHSSGVKSASADSSSTQTATPKQQCTEAPKQQCVATLADVEWAASLVRFLLSIFEHVLMLSRCICTVVSAWQPLQHENNLPGLIACSPVIGAANVMPGMGNCLK
jgi:hypothetical protein